MLQIETIARILLELNIPFTYNVQLTAKTLEVIKNGRIKPFFVGYYPDRQQLLITNNKHESVEINDLIKAINSLFIEPTN